MSLHAAYYPLNKQTSFFFQFFLTALLVLPCISYHEEKKVATVFLLLYLKSVNSKRVLGLICFRFGFFLHPPLRGTSSYDCFFFAFCFIFLSSLISFFRSGSSNLSLFSGY